MDKLKDKLAGLKIKTREKNVSEIIKLAYREFGRRVNFASSLGEDDQVITDIISKVAPQIEIFTLDTGRLFQETYDLLAKTQQRYRLNIKIYYPDTAAVEAMVKERGINLFYESVENRKMCCGVRKVEPLKRALKDVDAWICGLRREQSVTRKDIDVIEWDEEYQKIKINPLANWTLDDVHRYVKENSVDVNVLHSKGFVSIGCASCTRAVKPCEDIRAGRWWWERPEQRECGLHFHKMDKNKRLNQ